MSQGNGGDDSDMSFLCVHFSTSGEFFSGSPLLALVEDATSYFGHGRFPRALCLRWRPRNFGPQRFLAGKQ